MRQFRTVATILFALIATPLYAETNGVLRIGVLNDMSSVYADFQGPGSVIAAQRPSRTSTSSPSARLK